MTEHRRWNAIHFFSYYFSITFSPSSYNLGATLITIGLVSSRFPTILDHLLPSTGRDGRESQHKGQLANQDPSHNSNGGTAF